MYLFLKHYYVQFIINAQKGFHPESGTVMYSSSLSGIAGSPMKFVLRVRLGFALITAMLSNTLNRISWYLWGIPSLASIWALNFSESSLFGMAVGFSIFSVLYILEAAEFELVISVWIYDMSKPILNTTQGKESKLLAWDKQFVSSEAWWLLGSHGMKAYIQTGIAAKHPRVTLFLTAECVVFVVGTVSIGFLLAKYVFTRTWVNHSFRNYQTTLPFSSLQGGTSPQSQEKMGGWKYVRSGRVGMRLGCSSPMHARFHHKRSGVRAKPTKKLVLC
jgi:hypothetical protein